MTGWGYEDNDFVYRMSELFKLNLIRLSEIMPRQDLAKTLGEPVHHPRFINEISNNDSNRERSIDNIKAGKLVANQHMKWGMIHD